MSGQLRFRLDNEITSSGNPDRSRDIFTHGLNYFDDHPNFTRVASYYGVNGTGFGFSNASDESGENAWAIWRSTAATVAFDVALRWSYNSFSTAGVSGSWAAGSSNFGMSLCVAFHSSGQAFAGTTNNNGQDSFNNSNPWKSGSLCFPRQNMAAGSEETEQRLSGLFESSFGSGTGRLHIAGDDDGFVFAWDNTDNGSYDSLAVFEKFIPFVSGASVPYFFYCSDTSNNLVQNTALGSIVDSNTLQGGISLALDGTNEDHGINSGSYIPKTAYHNLYAQPIQLTSSADEPIREWPIIVGVDEGLAVGIDAPLGHLNLVRTSWQSLTSSDLLRSGSDDQRLALRTSTVSQPTLTMPWTASVSPSAGTFYSNATVFMTESVGFTVVTSSNLSQFASTVPATGGGVTLVPFYRGLVSSEFVYQKNTPPAGATDVVIIAFVEE